MDTKKRDLVCGWRGLSLAVTNILGRPVGVGRVRWIVESRALPVGQRLGAALVFDADDVAAVVALARDRLHEHEGGSDNDRAPEDEA